MNINTDFSFLFGGNSTGSSGLNSNLLADYASIKNGSYLKLMKAYYGKNEASKSNPLLSNSASKDSNETIATTQSDARDLQNSAEKLTTKGSKTLFKKKEVTKKAEDGTEETVMDYDKDAIYKGVKAFVDDYNSLIESASKSNSDKVLRQTVNLAKATKAYSNLLEKVGITIEKNGGKLTIDETAFKDSDMNSVKNLFNGNNSYAAQVASRASSLENAAASEASKAKTYNTYGGYGNTYSSGSIYSSYF